MNEEMAGQENCDDMMDGDMMMGAEEYEDDGSGGFGGRGMPPRNWGGPGPRDGPPRFRGRGYGPGGPPFRGRGPPPPLFGRGPPPRNGPPGGGPGGFNGPPNFGGGGPNWGPGPMGPPGTMGPPGIMGGPGGSGPFGPPGMMGGPPGMSGPPPHMMAGAGPGSGNGGAPGGTNGGGNGAQFGGPQGSGTPMGGVDMNSEIWVETKTGEGKSYYYNARTRETTWTKPDGPQIKIISQDQVEAMAQAVQSGATAASSGSTAPTATSSTMTPQTTKPTDISSPIGGGGDPSKTQPNTLQPPPNLMQGPPPGMPPFGGAPPFGMPPPGFQPSWQGPPGWPIPPTGATPWVMPGMGMQPSMDETMIMAQIDPDIIAKAAEWTEHKAPDGRSYFYNSKKAESVWEKPQPMKDLDNAKILAIHRKENEHKDPGNQIAAKPDQTDSSRKDQSSNQPISETTEQQKKTADTTTAAGTKPPGKSDETKPKETKPQDKSRPISSTPVPGTPWCVVWTGDGRVFFYNPSSRTSVWERPEDLVGRADVDKMLASPPDVLVPQQTQPGGVDSKMPAVQTKGGGTTPTTGKKRTESESSGENSDDAGTPAKKAKKEPVNNSANGLKIEKKNIDIGKEAAIEAEVRAAKERAVVPLEIRVKSFKEMLAEKDVSAFSTWEKELHKIVFDPRYLLLTSKERKQVFERYVKERAEDERREKRNKLRERKDAFKKLLSEAHLHGKSSFSDFAQKYAKEERFKNVEKMRERESLFNEYLMEVRKREKEEKSHRREQKMQLLIWLRLKGPGAIIASLHTANRRLLRSPLYHKNTTAIRVTLGITILRHTTHKSPKDVMLMKPPIPPRCPQQLVVVY